MIPVGEHTALVLENWWEKNKKDGTPVLVVAVEIPDAFDMREKHIGRIWFTEKSAVLARAQLKALGFDCDAHSLDEIDGSYFASREVVVTIVEDNYQGRTGTKIGRFGKSSKSAPPEDGALKAATALVRAAKADNEATPYSEPAEELPPLTSANLEAEISAAQATDDGVPF